MISDYIERSVRLCGCTRPNLALTPPAWLFRLGPSVSRRAPSRLIKKRQRNGSEMWPVVENYIGKLRLTRTLWFSHFPPSALVSFSLVD